MKYKFLLAAFALTVSALCADAADQDTSVVPDAFQPQSERVSADARIRRYLTPERVVWTSNTGVYRTEEIFAPALLQTSTADMRGGFRMEKKTDAPC